MLLLTYDVMLNIITHNVTAYMRADVITHCCAYDASTYPAVCLVLRRQLGMQGVHARCVHTLPVLNAAVSPVRHGRVGGNCCSPPHNYS